MEEVMVDLPKVLIVEDEDWRQEDFANKLDGRVNVLPAQTIARAEELFAANPDIAAIACDGCVPGKEFNTGSLVRSFRQRFAGPIIAMSSNPFYVEWLEGAGCDHRVSNKRDLPAKVLQVLGLD